MFGQRAHVTQPIQWMDIFTSSRVTQIQPLYVGSYFVLVTTLLSVND